MAAAGPFGATLPAGRTAPPFPLPRLEPGLDLAEEQAHALGDAAFALEARALSHAVPSADETLRVAFRASGLPARQRALLAGLPGTRFRRLSHGLERVDADPAALAAASPGEDALRALLAVHRLASRRLPTEPVLMGVVNVTPDSFSDGGRFVDPEHAIEHGLRLRSEGAAILDVGGESTRPGAAPVPLDEELARVLPVIEGLARATDAHISVDTSKPAVAARALAAGATVINDVTAGRDGEMLELVARAGCGYVAMHMRGTPRDMQDDPRYDDVVHEVTAFLRERARACWKAGAEPHRIPLAIDPGIGFGKRLEHNLVLLQRLPELGSLGLPLLVGVSRKSFLGRISGTADPERRGGETAAALTACVLGGASVLRVHDVASARGAVRVAAAIAALPAPP